MTPAEYEARAPADEEKDEIFIDEDDMEDALAQADFCNEYRWDGDSWER